MEPRLRPCVFNGLSASRAQGAEDPFRLSRLASRRSRREFTSRALTEQEISQLLWAAQGVTAAWRGRTSPSAGALYPLELRLLTAGVYGHYLPQGHRLEVLADRDLRPEAAAAAWARRRSGTHR